MNSSTPASSGREIYIELFLLSLAALYLELLVIRWMSADIRLFTVFRTFPLVTCFVGLGVGFGIGRDWQFRFTLPALLLLALTMKVPDLFPLVNSINLPTQSVAVGWLKIDTIDPAFWSYMAVPMLLLAGFLAAPFLLTVCLGSRVGTLFNQLKPLQAYSFNILGSIAGSVLFSVLCFQGLPPWQLLIAPVAIVSFYICRSAKVGWRGLSLAAAAACLAVSSSTAPLYQALHPSTTALPQERLVKEPSKTFWSPYQRIDVIPVRWIAGDGKQIIDIGIWLLSNRAFYQYALDLSYETFDAGKEPVLKEFLEHTRRHYALNYHFKPAGDVLVVASGSGSDVAEALRNGATSVDAVDIDPVIQKAGLLFNPSRPYQDPRVHVICDDARHFFNHCNKKYDLIVFGYLDSHVSTGQGFSVRLDNYVYTRESFAKAASLLKSDGLIVVSFWTLKDWLRDRLFSSMKEALGYTPILIVGTKDVVRFDTFLVAGQAVKNKLVDLNPVDSDAFKAIMDYKPVFHSVLTDDWPFIYVVPAPVDVPYLLVMAEVLLLAALAGRRVLFAASDAKCWQMFFLGGAFMLLELQSIARLSLLYGTSWLTSAMVINGVLIMIWFANLAAIKFGKAILGKEKFLYLGLLLALALSYFLPVNLLLEAGDVAAYFGITVVTVLPVLAAGLIFSTSFEKVVDSRKALSFNLFGSVVGAMLEYFSNYCGIRNLVLVAAALYLLSFLCLVYAQKRSLGTSSS